MSIYLPPHDTLTEEPLESNWLLIPTSQFPGDRLMIRMQSPEFSDLPEARITAETDQPGIFSKLTVEHRMAAARYIREEDLIYKEVGIRVLRRGLIAYFEGIAAISPECRKAAKEAIGILLNPYPAK